MTISTTDDQTLTIPDAFAGDFGVVLFYRGSALIRSVWHGQASNPRLS